MQRQTIFTPEQLAQLKAARSHLGAVQISTSPILEEWGTLQNVLAIIEKLMGVV